MRNLQWNLNSIWSSFSNPKPQQSSHCICTCWSVSVTILFKIHSLTSTHDSFCSLTVIAHVSHVFWLASAFANIYKIRKSRAANSNIMWATDVSYTHNFKFLSSHILKRFLKGNIHLIIYFISFNKSEIFSSCNHYKKQWDISHSLFCTKSRKSGMFFTLTAHLNSD